MYWWGWSWETAGWTSHQRQRFLGVWYHLLLKNAFWGMWKECVQNRGGEVDGKVLQKCPDAAAKRMSHGVMLAWCLTTLSSSRVTATFSIFHAFASSLQSGSLCEQSAPPIYTPQPVHPEPAQPTMVTVPAHISDHTHCIIMASHSLLPQFPASLPILSRT